MVTFFLGGGGGGSNVLSLQRVRLVPPSPLTQSLCPKDTAEMKPEAKVWGQAPQVHDDIIASAAAVKMISSCALARHQE